MIKVLSKPIKVTASLLLVAFLFTCLAYVAIYVLFNGEINMAISTLNLISINNEVVEENAVMQVFADGSKLIQNYPHYGQAYGNISVASVGIDLPIYFGDSLEILKNGAGQMTGSYFPGEGASIIIGAHHSNDKFGKLKDVKLNDIIEVKTSYGKFSYKIYDLKVINETDIDLLPIQKEKEILMLYTCYPFGYLGYTTKRYAVYANLLDYELIEVK